MKRKIVSIIICLAMLPPCTAFGLQTSSDPSADTPPRSGIDNALPGDGMQTLDGADVLLPPAEGDNTRPENPSDVDADRWENGSDPAPQDPEQENPAAAAEDPSAATGDTAAKDAETARDDTAGLAEDSEMEQLLDVRDNTGRASDLESIDADSYDGFLYVLKEDTSKKDMQEMDENIQALNTGQTKEPCIEEIAEDEIYAADSLESIDAVAEEENIAYIEPNYIRQLALEPRDGSINKKNTGNYRLIGVDLLWDHGITGKGVKVAVLDSGITGLKGGKVKHEDLSYKKITRGTTYAYKNVYTRQRYKKNYGNDDNGHGTFVAGEIAAKKNNKKGVSGLAPGVRLISIKISNKQGVVTDADCIKGLKLAKKKGAKVVNMSFAGTNYSSSVESACKKLAKSGILLIAASGNHGTTLYEYPASYSSVISVGAVDQKGNKTSYSEYNSRVDCVAPGNFYGLGKKTKSKYRSMKGTSMAAPVVSAYAAIVKSLKPGCTTSQFRKILKKTCTDKGAEGKDNLYGYGIVNFRSMYKYLTGTQLYPKAGASVSRMYSSAVSASRQYTGNPIRPAVSLDYLTRDKDYTVEYRDNTEVGTAKIILRGAGIYTGKKTITFRIVPQPTDLTSIRIGNRSVTLTWKSQTEQTSGYQLKLVYYTQTGKAKTQYVRIPSNQTTTKTVTGLKRGKTYYIHARTYQKADGEYYYSSWSRHYAYAYIK